MPTLTAACLTDRGKVRKMNQDSVVVLSAEELDCRLDGLYVVADGMGGKAGGEIASRVTVETVPDVVEEVLNEQTEGAGPQALSRALREALEAANDAVFTQARANPELRGMGTTCVAALVLEGRAVIGNVGDSRCYLLRGGKLAQITADHSLVQEHVRAGELTREEASASKFKNVITRAIGLASSVEPDIEQVFLQPGDTLLLCSDGLTNMVTEPDIEWFLSEQDVSLSCKKLVDAANRNGGIDNITVIVARYGAPHPVAATRDRIDEDEAPSILHRPPTGDRKRPGAAVLALLALVVLLGTALGVVGREHYEVRSAWPFFRKKAAAPPVQPAPPAIDFAKLTYQDPVMVIGRAVRAAPLVCDPAGNVFVVAAEGMVLRVSPDQKWPDRNWKVFVASDAAPRVSRASKHWATDPQGNLYVSSYADKKIIKYDPAGARIGTIGEGRLKGPEDIAVDAKGNVYVVDDSRLKLFRPAESAASTLNAQGSTPSAGAPDGSR